MIYENSFVKLYIICNGCCTPFDCKYIKIDNPFIGFGLVSKETWRWLRCISFFHKPAQLHGPLATPNIHALDDLMVRSCIPPNDFEKHKSHIS